MQHAQMDSVTLPAMMIYTHRPDIRLTWPLSLIQDIKKGRKCLRAACGSNAHVWCSLDAHTYVGTYTGLRIHANMHIETHMCGCIFQSDLESVCKVHI